ncbi:phage holin family protein [Rhodobacter maris]|uniref:LydA family holin superfamily III n=1 Tax=Rhodobacter maris TaxID=446682 RepID=A0A285TJA3_9RHOB|nr:phage holin family protein [Rhodobacter maris]SOC22123.1 LydA family holin superfamily III [Rhodobacter maris]
MSETRGLIEVADALFGGAMTTAAAAIAGRLMWHSAQVRSGRRRFFGRELFWELPIAIGMAIIGEAVAAYFELDRTVSTGVVASLAYLGPRGAEALLTRVFFKGKES